jgi:emopamil binding protein
VSATPSPLSRRPQDVAFIAFWTINFCFITYMIDIEQLVISDPAHFAYPIWPPRFAVDAIHWWARSFDPVVWARAPWYRATIWMDTLVFGPFYLFAIRAFWRGYPWIRIPCFVWAGMMIAVVTIILFEEVLGATPTAAPGIVVSANAPWLAFPLAVIWRMRHEDPFGAQQVTRPGS